MDAAEDNNPYTQKVTMTTTHLSNYIQVLRTCTTYYSTILVKHLIHIWNTFSCAKWTWNFQTGIKTKLSSNKKKELHEILVSKVLSPFVHSKQLFLCSPQWLTAFHWLNQLILDTLPAILTLPFLALVEMNAVALFHQDGVFHRKLQQLNELFVPRKQKI